MVDQARPASPSTDGVGHGRAAALVRLLRDAARLDLTQSDPVVALRNAVGVAAPLLIGLLTGAASIGVLSTVGALQTAFADRPGPYRLRLLRMLATALAAAVTSGLAVLASRNDVASVLLLLVLAFAAALLLTAGPSATQVGIAGTAAALVIGHLPQSPGAAGHVALLVLAGGAGQTVLAIAAWPLGRHRPERYALAGLYRELATAARIHPGAVTGPPATGAVDAVRQAFYGLGHDHGPSVEAYRVLLDEAERIRREIVVLTAHAERLADDGEAILAGQVRSGLAGAAAVLDEVAAALEDGRRVDPQVLAPARENVRRAVHRFEEDGAAGELTVRAAAARLASLSGQLRAVVETAATGASEGGHEEVPDVYGVRRLRDPLAILRANLTPSSAVQRHAVRLAVLVAGSDLVVRLAGINRGYWVALTLLVVLRPDFGTTLQRAVLRTLGTIVGLLLATALVHWVPGGTGWQVALIAVAAFGMRLAGPGNIGLSAVSLSALVVVLLSLTGVPPHTTVVARAVATAIGGGLALVSALFFPLWERQLVPQRLSALLAAYRDYLAAITAPDADVHRRQAARAAARVARTNAQASVDRARAEPVRGAAAVELGSSVLANSHRVIHALLTVDAVREQIREAGGLPEFDELARRTDAALAAAENALLTSRPPRQSTSLRRAQQELVDAVRAQPERVGGAEVAGALIDASDRLVNGLDTMVAELRRQLGTRTALTSNA